MNKRGISMVHASVILVLVLGMFAGFMAGVFYEKKNSREAPGSQNNQLAQLQSQLDKAKKYFPSIPDTKSLIGTVKQIKGGIITIETLQPPNPFEELPTSREVAVTASTKIVRQEQKSPQDYGKEMAEFQKKIQQNANGSIPSAVPPVPFVEKPLGLADIKINDQIIVESDKNIKADVKFEATRIVVQQIFTVTPPPAPMPVPTQNIATNTSLNGSLPPAPAPPPR